MPLYCPACKSTYQDETLAFCLSDGTRLMPLGNNSEATVQISPRTDPGRVSLQNSDPTVQINSPAPPQKAKRTGLIIGLSAVLLLALVAVAGSVGAYFMFGGKNDTVSATPTPNITPLPINTAVNSNSIDKTNAATKELEEKLNRLEKQLEEQQKLAGKTNSASSGSTPTQTGYATARVNSPNDGFLALRSDPDTEIGAQIMKIPHGATVVLNNCEKNTVKIGGRSGRWCQVDYANKSGWVFSAWLDY